MSDTCPAPIDGAAFGTFTLMSDVGLLESQVRLNQVAPPISTTWRLAQ